MELVDYMNNVKILQFGTLMIKGCIMPIPKIPTYNGDIIGYGRAEDICISNSVAGKDFLINWIELAPDLYIADRNLINNISWDSLNEAGLVFGNKRLLIDGEYYALRLPSGSDGKPGKYGRGCHNEWDQMMDLCHEDNNLAHWYFMYNWCKEDHFEEYRNHVVRGSYPAREIIGFSSNFRDFNIGWRPVLQRL